MINRIHEKGDGIYGFENDAARFLSNFYKTPKHIFYEGISYPTSEHAYQAAKTLDFEQRHLISQLWSPATAKRLGRALKMRPDWDRIKRGIMKDILRIKFSQPELREKLLATDGLYLEETNHWNDTYWGVCRGKGQNHLGQVLMEIRQEIQQQEDIRWGVYD